jgi:pyruvate ferredoxin oxidoreductase delta subunit
MKNLKALKGWKDIPIAGLIDEPSTSLYIKTGDWRTFQPVYKPENCIQCLFCWVYCPDSAIIVKEERVVGINYDYCKGCGICAYECPTKDKAIVMVREEK